MIIFLLFLFVFLYFRCFNIPEQSKLSPFYGYMFTARDTLKLSWRKHFMPPSYLVIIFFFMISDMTLTMKNFCVIHINKSVKVCLMGHVKRGYLYLNALVYMHVRFIMIYKESEKLKSVVFWYDFYKKLIL